MKHEVDVLGGDIGKTLVKLALPITWGMLCELFYNIADAYFLSLIDKSNPAIMAGVGLVFPVFFLMAAFAIGLSSGVSTKTAIAIGANEPETALKTIASGIVLGLISGVAIMLMVWLSIDVMINLLAGKGIGAEAKGYSRVYLLWLMPGFLSLFPSQALFGSLQGEGKTRYIGMAIMVSTLINVILDPVFIFTFKFGVSGAAMATSIAHIFTLLFALSVYWRKKSGFTIRINRERVSAAIMKQITFLGMPLSVGFLMLSASLFALNWFVGNVSQEAMNAFALAFRFDYMLIIPAISFSIALGIMIGQSYGNKNFDRVRKIYRTGLRKILYIVIAVSLFYIAIAPYLLSAFTDVDEVINIAVRQIRWITLATSIGSALGIASGNAFQSIADPLRSLATTVLRNIVITVPLLFILSALRGDMIENVWIGIAVGNLAGGGICYFWCKSKLRGLRESAAR